LDESRDGHEVDEEQMAIVRHVFRMVGTEGATLYAVRKALEAAGVSSPGDAKLWRQGYLRAAILDDIYRPHTFEELEGIVSPEVLARLDPTSATASTTTTVGANRRGRSPRGGRTAKPTDMPTRRRETAGGMGGHSPCRIRVSRVSGWTAPVRL
jgi:hypothetical protein